MIEESQLVFLRFFITFYGVFIMTQDIVIVDAVRTPIGAFLGGLSSTPAHKLGETVIKALLERTGVKADAVSEVIFGQVLTAGQGQNPARQAARNAGLGDGVPAWSINQVCGSGLRTVGLAMQAIACGDAEIVIAGGQENMSMSPHTMHARNGSKMGPATLADSMVVDGLWDAFNDYHMGMIVPNRKGDITIDMDEHPKPGTSAEKLGGLRPAFDKAGTVTAGNASGINDGAAALMIMTADKAKELGLEPLATIRSWAQAGVAPDVMGTGPIPASTKALEKAGWKADDLDLIEANEAFAAQAIAVNKKMGWDTDKVNVNGGAIALGHPIGASGARVLVTLLHAMKARDAKKGLATLCIGGGMGVALTVER